MGAHQRGGADACRVAEQLAVSDYKVLAAPSIYHKRFNFAADLAAWEGATIQLRTKAAGTTDTKSQLLAERDVCVVLLQRKCEFGAPE